MNNYNVRTYSRTAVPRSERLKGGGFLAGSSSSRSTGVSGGGVSGATHSHENKDLLDAFTLDEDLYLNVLQKAEGEDDSSLVKIKAGYADMALTNADGYTLDWFIPQTDGSLKLNPKYSGLYADGFMTGGGKGTGGSGSGGGLIQTVYGVSAFGGTFDSADNTATFNAYAINSLHGRVSALEQNPTGVDASWGSTSGYTSPLTVAGTTKTVLLSGALSGYATQSWVNNQGFLKSYSEQYRGTVTGLKLGTVSYSPEDGILSLPSYPTALKSPSALTFGGKSYDGSAAAEITAANLGALTEHQSLANYVTLDGTQTIFGSKTFSTGLVSGGDIIPTTDSAGSIGYSNRRWGNLNIRNVGASSYYLRDGETWDELAHFGAGSDYFGLYLTGNELYFFGDGSFQGRGTTKDLGASWARWGKLWAAGADLTGDLSMAATSKITLGPVTIEYDATNKVLYVHGTDGGVNIGICTDGPNTGGGIKTS